MPATFSPDNATPQRSLGELLRDINFLSVAYIVLVTHIAFFSIFAVIPLRLENDLGAGEAFFALYGVVELLAGAGTTMIIGRVIAHRGSRFALVTAMFMTGVGGLILAVAPHATFTLIAAALTGAGWTAVGIASLGFFSERTQAQDIKAAQLFHQMIFGAMFIGPLLGSMLADSGMALTAIMLMGAGLRFFAAFLTHQGLGLFTGRKVEPITTS